MATLNLFSRLSGKRSKSSTPLTNGDGSQDTDDTRSMTSTLVDEDTLYNVKHGQCASSRDSHGRGGLGNFYPAATPVKSAACLAGATTGTREPSFPAPRRIYSVGRGGLGNMRFVQDEETHPSSEQKTIPSAKPTYMSSGRGGLGNFVPKPSKK